MEDIKLYVAGMSMEIRFRKKILFSLLSVMTASLSGCGFMDGSLDSIVSAENRKNIVVTASPFVVTGTQLKSDLSVTVTDAAGNPTIDYQPDAELYLEQEVFSESFFSKVRQFGRKLLANFNAPEKTQSLSSAAQLICSRTNHQGKSSCELRIPIPDSTPYEFILRLAGQTIELPLPLVAYPSPTLSAVSKNTVSFDNPDTFVLTGTQFRQGMSVQIDSVECSSIEVLSTTSAKCTTAPHAVGGPYDIVVRMEDQQEGVLNAAVSFRDMSAPTVNFTLVPPARSNQSSFSFEFNASDNFYTSPADLTFQCRVNGGAYVNCSSPYVATGFTQGEDPQVLTIKVSDPLGNTQEYSHSWIYDSEAPTLVILTQNGLSPSPSKDTTAVRSVTVGGDDVVEYKYKVVSNGDCALVDFSTLPVHSVLSDPTISFTPSLEQAYTVCAIGRDSAGSWQTASNATASSTLVMDTHVSAFSGLAFAPISPGNDTTPLIVGQTEAGALVSLYRSDATCTGTALSSSVAHSSTGIFSLSSDTSPLGIDGEYAFYVKTTDLAGNVLCSGVMSYVLDRLPPNLVFSAPAEGAAAQSQLTVSGNCEPGLNVNYYGVGILSPFSQLCPGSGNFSQVLYLSAGEGAKPVSLSQTDAAGNSTSISKTFLRDSTAPVLTQTLRQPVSFSKLDTMTFGGVCETGLNVAVNGADSNSVACENSNWSYTTAAKTLDGVYSYTFTQTDPVGNQSSVSAQFVRDTAEPLLEVDSSNPVTNALTSASWSGTCESGLSISVSGAVTSTLSCNGGFWSLSDTTTENGTKNYLLTQIDLAGNEKQLALSWIRNDAIPELQLGSGQSLTIKNAADSATWSGTCETNVATIEVTGADTQTISCAGGTWSYSNPTQTSDGVRAYTLTQTNEFASSASLTLTWYRDTLAPVLQDSFFTLNDGAVSTSSRQVQVDLKAVDGTTNISHFCLKTVAGDSPGVVGTPVTDDSCWTAVNAPMPGLSLSKTLQLSGFAQALDFVDGVYTILGWVRDEVGNISGLSSAGVGTNAKDKASITLVQGSPPNLTKLFGSRTDNSYPPLLGSDEVVAAGGTLYIKWKVTDDQALPSNAVRLYFTLDDSQWTEITSGGIPNGVNGSCTLADDYTGCYTWSVPTGGFIRIRAVVTDAIGKQVLMSSNAINTSPMRILAGNVSTGLGGDGKNAVFLVDPKSVSNRAQPHSFVISRNGDIYVIDHYRGLLKVSASTGLVTQFIKQTGAISGDGGPITGATSKYVYKVALDPQDRLWIWDYNTIRRIDIQLPNPVIQTMIGGGSDTGDTVLNPLDLSLRTFVDHSEYNGDSTMPFIFSPNGNLYFASEVIHENLSYSGSTIRLRVYRSDLSSPRVESIVLGGTGFSGNTTQSLAGCGALHRGLGFSSTGQLEMIYGVAVKNNYTSRTGDCATTSTSATFNPVRFNPNDGQATAPHPPAVASIFGSGFSNYIPVTGRNGKLYILSKDDNYLYRYDYDPSFASAGTMTLIAGNGVIGACVDGTTALSCAMDPSDVFVDEQNRVYVYDAGRIRMIEDDGSLTTIAGVNINEGTTKPALLSRYVGLMGLDLDPTSTPGKLITTDIFFQRMYEITLEGDSKNIAGNGIGAYPNTTSPASTQNYVAKMNDTFAHVFVHPLNGLIYATSGSRLIGTLDRAADRWTTVLGGGGTFLQNTSNTPGLSLKLNAPSPAVAGYTSVPIGLHNGELLVISNGGYSNGLIWSNLLSLSATEDEFKTRLFAGTIGESGGNHTFCSAGTPTASCQVGVNRFATYNRSFYDEVTATWLVSAQNTAKIYRMGTGKNVEIHTMPHSFLNFAYRRDGTDEVIYYCNSSTKRIHKQVLGGGNSTLTWPLTSLNCSGLSMVFDENRQVLIFLFESNGLMGIAETSDF